MFELSDWGWLIILGIWMIVRILPRLFRSGSPTEPAQAAEPHSPAESAVPTDGWPAQADMGQERMGDVGSEPIEPR